MMSRRHAAAVLALLLASGSAVPLAQRRPPKLIVLLVVDQMRGDYLDRFGHQWTAGLRRLMDEGAVFKQANYSYFGTLTCAGHATISTGTVPATHGMLLDGWLDRATGRRVSCTSDPDAKVIRYGAAGRGGNGPMNIAVPTFADELRTQSGLPSKIASFSIKARAAIGLAGHKGDAVAWFDDGSAWVTSTAYTAVPVPFVAEFVKANPVEKDFGKTWQPLLPQSAYLYSDGVPAETSKFPHVLKGTAEQPDAKFYTAWETSPFSDEYTARMGMAAIDGLGMGKGPGTDFLALSFSAPDLVGHEYGPRSHEVQDVFARLDATLGTLLSYLDRRVGRGEYVVAFTSDHGVAPIPEWATTVGFDAGRIVREDTAQKVDAALQSVLGPGKYVAGMNHIEFYFAPGVYQKLLANPAAMKVALDTLNAVPGVARVYRSEELAAGTAGTDPLTTKVMRSYFPGRSGDLVVIPKAYWYTWNRGADHGTGYVYDTHVPVILMGRGIKPGEYLAPADPADVAPTLAFLAGITLARPDGRLLTEAIAPPEAPVARPTATGESRPGGQPVTQSEKAARAPQ